MDCRKPAGRVSRVYVWINLQGGPGIPFAIICLERLKAGTESIDRFNNTQLEVVVVGYEALKGLETSPTDVRDAPDGTGAYAMASAVN